MSDFIPDWAKDLTPEQATRPAPRQKKHITATGIEYDTIGELADISVARFGNFSALIEEYGADAIEFVKMSRIIGGGH